MKEFEKKLGYVYGDYELLDQALTHSSYANEHGLDRIESNERLEFLGDSVLSIIVTEHLFSRYPKLPEGELTKLRASLVCETSLYEFAQEIDLGSFIKLGKGEIKSGGMSRASILSDCFEALIASIFLDGGIEPARCFVMRFVNEELKKHEGVRDYKTALQEVIQKNPEEKIRYVVTDESGPDHDKSFTVEVRMNSNVIGKGVGHSKKAAEQSAAKEALELMGL